MKFYFLSISFFFIVNHSFGQQKIIGKITDYDGKGLGQVQIFIKNVSQTFSAENGNYELEIDGSKPNYVTFYYSGIDSTIAVRPFTNEFQTINFQFKDNILDETEVKSTQRIGLIEIDAKILETLPTISGNVEDLIKSLPGVTSNNELSANYNVRGGNYDENLVYINDFEIFRSFLTRAGQQEGLSIINADMVQNIKFSAGGFSSIYGDRLSSVLDVEYKRPKKFAIGFDLSLLGARTFLEFRPRERFQAVVGARFQRNTFIFNSLDVAGDYAPTFLDLQGIFTYKINSKTDIQWLSILSYNDYSFFPQSQTTKFGTQNIPLQLNVALDGREQFQYNNYFNGLKLSFRPNINSIFKILASHYLANELERTTTQGAYRLSELEQNSADENFGEPKLLLGEGYFINNIRNRLWIDVTTLEFKALQNLKNAGNIQYGYSYRIEGMNDRLNQWVYNDSANFRINYFDTTNRTQITLDDYLSGKNKLESNRHLAYFNYASEFLADKKMRIEAGLRFSHWTYNKQSLFSPRAEIAFEPGKTFNLKLKKEIYNRYNHLSKMEQTVLFDSLKKKEITWRIASGIYYQPAFYRELRNSEGKLFTLDAQRSIHFIAGLNWKMRIWGRPFVYVVESYYKKLDFLVPYYLDNIRIRYLPESQSKGYALGIDSRINGEFVPGLESWFTMGLLTTKEKITYSNDLGNEQETNFLRRPTDQRFTMSIMFQDELPSNNSFRVHLNLSYASNIPYFLGGQDRFREGFTIPAYRRVDIGFSKVFIDKEEGIGKKDSKFNKLWLSLEIFNILNFNNTISYLWVRDVQGINYAVPNYLTARLLNIKTVIRI